MATLTPRERELVALGAALGSNCIPCIERHIPEARRTGLGDGEIREALELADKVRQVPARKSLQAALSAVGGMAAVQPGAQEWCEPGPHASPCC